MFNFGDDFEVDENIFSDVFSSDKRSSTLTHNTIPPPTPNNSFNLPKLPQENSSSDLFNKSINNFCRSSNQLHYFENKTRTSTNPVLGNFQHDSIVRTSLRERSLNVRSRKFPGPAGLLPERQRNTSFIATDEFIQELETQTSPELPKEGEVLSQETANCLEGDTWEELLIDLGSRGRELVDTINLESVKLKARNVRALKVPFLAVVLQAIDSTMPDPCLFLRDCTGEMCGALHRDVWEKMAEDLVVGCVLVLVNVGVVSAGYSSTRHYLNITSNNVATIYTPQKNNDVKVTQVNPMCKEDTDKFLKSWLHLSSKESQIDQAHSTSLFSMISPVSSPIPSTSYPTSHSYSRQRNQLPPQRRSNPIQTEQHVLQKSYQTPKRPSPNPTIPSCRISSYQDLSNKRPRNYDSQIQSVSAILSPSTSHDESVVESLLEGIDTDSLFGDF